MAAVMFTKEELGRLKQELSKRPSYRNLHSRSVRQVNGQRVLKHLNGMTLTRYKNEDGIAIQGHVFVVLGSKEIAYEVDNKGQVTISLVRGLSRADALKYVLGITKEILSRIGVELPTGVYPRRKKGQLYLRRSKKQEPSPSAKEAVQNGELSKDFVDQMAKWKLQIIRGRKK